MNHMFNNNSSCDDNQFCFTKPVRGENKVVEWDNDTNRGFAVFGRQSGHKYGVYETAARALMEYPEAD